MRESRGRTESASVPHGARWTLSGELGGAFADLGILVPLLAALVTINGLNPTTAFLGVGMAYILAGCYFGFPMPVQPLKAFAAIAIAAHVSPSVIAAGALWMSALCAVLAVTGLVDLFARWTPLGVVRGIQLGLGLLLVKNGWEFIASKPFFIGGPHLMLGFVSHAVPWGVPMALAGGLVLLALRRSRLPSTLVLLMLGAAAGVALAPGRLPALAIGPAPWTPTIPAGADFLVALALLVIPQFPLSLANSVLATSDAAKSYFGERARRATPRAVSLSIALANLWAGVTGGLPVCHGCGGLTAHYRLGARTPLATAMLGGLLIGVALLLGAAALHFWALVPYSIYGVLLLYVGIQHLKLGWAVPHAAARVVAVVTAGAAMAADGNLAVGALVGATLSLVVRIARRVPRPAPPVVD